MGNAPVTLDDVYRTPGHLVRRCQQISASLFAELVGDLDITSVQYAALVAIRDRPGIDQRSLGRTVAVDRSTIATVTRGLERRGLITRQVPPTDLRAKVLHITDAGTAVLDQAVEPVAEVQRRLLEPLADDEREIFLRLLSIVVDINNDHSRAPLMTVTGASRD